MCVLGGVVMPESGTEKMLASHTEKVWKFTERRELATPCWAKRMGAEKKGEEAKSPWWCRKWPLRGKERAGWEKMGGGRSIGRSKGKDAKPGHLLQRAQLWTLWEKGHSWKLCVCYIPNPRFSLAAFTLHRSAITKPIKKPKREASAVSPSPLADLVTRIIA